MLQRLFLFLGAVTLMLICLRLLKSVLTGRPWSSSEGKQEKRTSLQPAHGLARAPRQTLHSPSQAQAAPSGAHRPMPSPKRSVTGPARGSSRQPRARERSSSRQSSRLRWENVLLAVEVGAILLLLLAGAALWHTRRDLNDTYRSLQQTDPRLMPTLIAAAVPQQVVQAPAENLPLAAPPALPTPFPTVTPIAVPDIGRDTVVDKKPSGDEDEDTRAQWGMTAVMARLDDGGHVARRLQIPAIGVDSFIFRDFSDDWLKLGVVQVGQPVLPGQPGNLVLAGHNDIYGEIFRDLDQLQPGDEIQLLADSTGYTYRVRETIVVAPDDVWVTLPTATPTVTLVSCYPYLIGNQRIVVFADYAPQVGETRIEER